MVLQGAKCAVKCAVTRLTARWVVTVIAGRQRPPGAASLANLSLRSVTPSRFIEASAHHASGARTTVPSLG